MKLSDAQQELLDAMRKGVKVRLMAHCGPSASSYYFRSDTKKRCTNTAFALLSKKLVRVTKEDWRGHLLVVADKEQPK